MTCLEIQHPTIEVSSPPVLKPVSVDEAKKYCDYDDDDRDSQFNSWIKAATEAVEQDSERALITQTCKLYLPWFPSVIEICKPPVTAVSSIAYVDDNGDTQTLSASVYQTNLKRTPPRIMEAYNQVWPTTRDYTDNVVTVTFTAGYGNPESVPHQAKEAVLVLVKRMFYGCDGDAQDSPAYQSLINRLRWRPFV